MQTRKSLKFKSLVFVAVVVTGILLAFSLVNAMYERNDLKNRLQQYAALTLATSSLALARPVWDLDEGNITAYLQSLEKNPEYCGAVITDKHDKIIARKLLPHPKDSFTVQRPIIYQEGGLKENLGNLSLCFSNEVVNRTIAKKILLTASTFFGLLVLMLVVIFQAIGFITKPLDAIRRALGNVASGMEKITGLELTKENEIGEVTHAFNVMIDDLKASQTALIAAKEKAEEANRLKSEFLANVSHELRTPLNSILLLTQESIEHLGKNAEAEQRENLDIVYRNGNFLLGLINDLLDFTKIEAGKMTVFAESIATASLLIEIREMFDPIARKRGVEFTVEKSVDFPAVLVSDRLKLFQVIKNLLSNAFKFTEHGSVALKCYRVDAETLAVSVADTGIGIPADKMQAIFQSFQQADGSIARRYGGTGLGLSISQAFGKLLGGGIDVTSQEGQGSRFTLTFAEKLGGKEPVDFSEDTMESIAADMVTLPKTLDLAPAQEISGLKDRKILLVDNDVRSSFQLAKSLNDAGMQVLMATDEEKLRLVLKAHQDIDAMLVNTQLPQALLAEVSGNDACIIGMTDLEDGKQSLEGAVNYLRKPVDLSSLYSVLHQFIHPLEVRHGS